MKQTYTNSKVRTLMNSIFHIFLFIVSLAPTKHEYNHNVHVVSTTYTEGADKWTEADQYPGTVNISKLHLQKPQSLQ